MRKLFFVSVVEGLMSNLTGNQPIMRSCRLGSIAVAIFLTVCVVASCSEENVVEVQATGDVIGKVYFEESDRTIPKVVVTIAEREYKTVTNGEFVLPSIPYGDYTITAAKGGYRTHISEVVVNAPEIEHNVRLWFTVAD
jgi:hypothetical protein